METFFMYQCQRCKKASPLKANMDRHVTNSCRGATVLKRRYTPNYLDNSDGANDDETTDTENSPPDLFVKGNIHVPKISLTKSCKEITEYETCILIRKIKAKVPIIPRCINEKNLRALDIVSEKREEIRRLYERCESKESLVVNTFRLVTGDMSLETHRYVWRINGSNVMAALRFKKVLVRDLEEVRNRAVEHSANMVGILCNKFAEDPDLEAYAKAMRDICGTSRQVDEIKHIIDKDIVWAEIQKHFATMEL